MSSVVQIKDSAYDGLQSLRVYGNTAQNLWVNPSGTKNGVTVTANADGSITLSGTATALTNIFTYAYNLKPGGTYCLTASSVPSGVSFSSRAYDDGESAIATEIATTAGAVFVANANAVKYGCVISINSGATVSGTYRVMLNEGSTAEPWCPPGLNSVGDGGSVDIVTAGKNLLKQKSNLIARTVNGIKYTPNGDGSVKVSGTSIGVADFYLIGKTWSNPATNPLSKLQEEMVLSGGVKDCEIVLYGVDDDGNHVLIGSTKSIATVIPGDSEGMKLGNWICYLSIAANKTIDAVIYPQFELGSTATSYEPPNITTTPIDLQSNSLRSLPDGTRDELHIDGGGNVVLEKRVQKVLLDGKGFTFTESTTSGGSIRYAYGPVDTGDSGSVYGILCDTVSPGSVTNYENKFQFAGVVPNSSACMSVGTDLSSANEWIRTRPTTVIYPLAEPQTIDLGTVELPKLRKNKVNNIWVYGRADTTDFSLAPDIEVDYYRWKPCSDGFKADGKHTSRDFGMCIASRDTGTPEKKAITATVPYMSGFYDFSALYGSPAYESREVTYTFEFLEDSTEALQEKKSAVLDWLTKIQDVPIYDDDLEWKHFIGSYSGSEFEENEDGISGTLEVTFLCQPFIEADRDTTVTLNAGARTVTVKGQPVNAYAKTSSGTATIQIGGVTQSVGTTEIRLSVQLQPGDNAVTVTGSPVVLRWKELTA